MDLFSLGVSMYITCDLGQGPYDGIAPAIDRQFPKISYHTFRVAQDVLAIMLALVLTGFDLSLGIVAIGTIIMGFFLGPIIGFCIRGSQAVWSGRRPRRRSWSPACRRRERLIAGSDDPSIATMNRST